MHSGPLVRTGGRIPSILGNRRLVAAPAGLLPVCESQRLPYDATSVTRRTEISALPSFSPLPLLHLFALKSRRAYVGGPGDNQTIPTIRPRLYRDCFSVGVTPRWPRAQSPAGERHRPCASRATRVRRSHGSKSAAAAASAKRVFDGSGGNIPAGCSGSRRERLRTRVHSGKSQLPLGSRGRQ